MLRVSSCGHTPLLVGGAGARPDLQPGSVRTGIAGRVEALVRRRPDDVPGRRRRPSLVRRPAAVPQLQLRTVRCGLSRDVEALAQRADRAVGADRPLLRTRAVAVVELDGRAVGAAGVRDVQALAAESGDRTGLAGAAAAALVAGPGERRRRVAGQGVGERGVAPVHAHTLVAGAGV